MATDMETKQDATEQPVIENADASPPPTLTKQLKIQDFMFTSSEPRRSRRVAKTGDETPHPLSPPLSAPKRKSESSTSTNDASRKKQRGGSGYAPPSAYAHLPLLPDAMGEKLLILFIGLNPGVETARSGHAYAHPSNLFWRLLYSSGITPRKCLPQEDGDMPKLYHLGFTNIVSRPSRTGSELKNAELDEGVAALQEKARKWRPESVCIVGKGIWESIWRVRHGKPVGKNFKYGWQKETENMGAIKGEWKGAKVFVGTSTSGLAVNLSLAEKEKIWSELGAWVKNRRVEREEEAAVASTATATTT